MAPRMPLMSTNPELITAGRIAHWLGITAAGVRVAAARGKIPAPSKVQATGVRGERITVNAWSEQDRDAILAWARGNGHRPWVPPHLEARVEPFDASVTETARVAVVPAGQEGSCGLAKETVLHPEASESESDDEVVAAAMASPAGSASHVDLASHLALIRRGNTPSSSWPPRDTYILHLTGRGAPSCTLVPLNPETAWPFALTFSAAEVADVLGRWPIGTSGANPRLLGLTELRIGHTTRVHPALASSDPHRVDSVRRLHRLVRTGAGSDQLIQLAQAAVDSAGSDVASISPWVMTQLEGRIDVVLDVDQVRPGRGETTPEERRQIRLTPQLRSELDTQTLTDVVRMWSEAEGETYWEPDERQASEDRLIRAATESVDPPMGMVAKITGYGRWITEDTLGTLRASKAVSSSGEELVVVSLNGWHLVRSAFTCRAPESALVHVELPRRIVPGPALGHYADGEVWPLPLGCLVSGHTAGYLGAGPSGLLRSMIAAATAEPGQLVDPDQQRVSPSQMQVMADSPEGCWTREQILEIAAMASEADAL